MKVSTDNLRRVLVDSGFVKPQDFDDAAQSASDMGRKVEDILVFRGLVTTDALAKMIAQYLRVPYADLAHFIIPDQTLQIIPEKLARTYRMVPIGFEANSLNLAMEDPQNFEAIELAKRHTNMQIVPHYATEIDIRRALGQYKRSIRAEFDRVIEESVKQATPGEDVLKAAENLPIVKMLDTIVEFGTAERASDIHIEVQAEQVVVRFRIDGVLRDIIKLPRTVEEALVARVKILSNLKLDERRAPQDGRFKYKIDEEAISLRISIIPGFYGENVVMRILRESDRPQSLEELGLFGRNLEVIKKNMYKPHGMMLITGPTGSGKTTTLYSILNILNTVRVKIATIEDPIEYGIARVTQIQVQPKVGLDFAAGLRALLRHDPDIMMVGEIRDGETGKIAVHAALTGHLVLSTLHTNDTVGAIPRLSDMGVENYLVASTVNVIIAQRLVRKVCSACLVEYKPEQPILDRLSREFDMDLVNQKFYKGGGCAECGGTGFSGRVGIYEVLEVTEAIRSLINDKSGTDEIREVAEKEGMVSMLRDGVDKVSSGLTTIEEVLKAVLEE